jgi:hypothetical protein
MLLLLVVQRQSSVLSSVAPHSDVRLPRARKLFSTDLAARMREQQADAG